MCGLKKRGFSVVWTKCFFLYKVNTCNKTSPMGYIFESEPLHGFKN